MALTVTEVRTRRELREFIYVPARIHRDHKIWIPPIYMDDWKYFDAKKNRAFTYSDTTLAIARKDGKTVGRIMGIVNRRYNEAKNTRIGRFGFLECYEDQQVFLALMSYVENWARKLGMNKLVGPMGFTDQDPQGFLIEGFDQQPTLAAYHNFEYLVRFLDEAGYAKEVDYVDYLIKVPDKLPDFYEKISARLARQKEFTLLEFAKSSQLKPYIRKVFVLMNETYPSVYGYVPMDDQEMDALAKQYLPVIDPRFVKMVTRGEDLVAFIIAMPNFNEGLRRSKGHIFPFGILHIMAAMKKTRQLDLFLGAIHPTCRGRGLDVMMGAAMMRAAMAAKFEQMDSHHELEDNLKVRAEMERVGGRVIERFRIYQTAL